LIHSYTKRKTAIAKIKTFINHRIESFTVYQKLNGFIKIFAVASVEVQDHKFVLFVTSILDKSSLRKELYKVPGIFIKSIATRAYRNCLFDFDN